MANMSIVQGATTVNLSISRDTYWRYPVQVTEHQFIGTDTSTVQWGSTGSAIREIVGTLTTFTPVDQLNTIATSKATCVFTADQPGDTATVVIQKFEPDRQYDAFNFERCNIRITLMKRS